jgi:hypothetical protein
MSFVAALATMPGTLSDEELKSIMAGKAARGELDQEDLTPAIFEELRRYTGLELKGLTRVMEKVRSGLEGLGRAQTPPRPRRGGARIASKPP